MLNEMWCCSLPLGPRLDRSTDCKPVAAPMLSWSACAARATSAFGFSCLIADIVGRKEGVDMKMKLIPTDIYESTIRINGKRELRRSYRWRAQRDTRRGRRARQRESVGGGGVPYIIFGWLCFSRVTRRSTSTEQYAVWKVYWNNSFKL